MLSPAHSSLLPAQPATRIDVHPLPEKQEKAAFYPAMRKVGQSSAGFGHQQVDSRNINKEMTLADAIDVINPLQHIPIVSTLYRQMTGDTIAPEMQMAGGALFGGIVGVAAAAVSALVEQETGRGVGEHALASVMNMPETKQMAKQDAAPIATLSAINLPQTPTNLQPSLAPQAADYPPIPPAAAGMLSPAIRAAIAVAEQEQAPIVPTIQTPALPGLPVPAKPKAAGPPKPEGLSEEQHRMVLDLFG